MGYPNLCKNIEDANTSGYYTIENNNNKTTVYCLFDVNKLNTSNTYTFKYINNGKTTTGISDDNSSKDYGLQIFVPRSPEEYNIAVNYVSNIYGKSPSNWNSYTYKSNSNGGLGPMGLYYDNSFEGSVTNTGYSLFETKNLHSYHYSDNTIDEDVYNVGNGWKTIANTDKFWLSSTTVDNGEPNGDYRPGTWLGFSWDDSGNLTNFNDRAAKYGYSSYLCTQKY